MRQRRMSRLGRRALLVFGRSNVAALVRARIPHSGRCADYMATYLEYLPQIERVLGASQIPLALRTDGYEVTR